MSPAITTAASRRARHDICSTRWARPPSSDAAGSSRLWKSTNRHNGASASEGRRGTKRRGSVEALVSDVVAADGGGAGRAAGCSTAVRPACSRSRPAALRRRRQRRTRITGAARPTIHHTSSPIISGAVTVACLIIAELRKRNRAAASTASGQSSSQERTCVHGNSRSLGPQLRTIGTTQPRSHGADDRATRRQLMWLSDDGFHESDLKRRPRSKSSANRRERTDHRGGCRCFVAGLSMAIWFSPTAAIVSPHWWPWFLPTGGHQISPPW